MLRNYVLVALRALRRRKAYATINVLGLAVGMACCMLIATYVRQEVHVDAFHEKGDRIVRVVRDVTEQGVQKQSAYMMPVLKPTLEAELPEVEAAVRVTSNQTPGLLRHGDRLFTEDRLLLADPELLSVFSFELLRGHPDEALAEPFTIVLTETTARTYFGDADPIGQTLTADNLYELTVTGVVADVPAASHLQFDGLISYASWAAVEDPEVQEDWGYNNLMIYALLREDVSVGAAEANLNAWIDRNVEAELAAEDVRVDLVMEPLRSIYLHSSYGGLGLQGSAQNVRVFSVVALFILLLAVFNFTNLATARSAERAREVGVRKTIGASRSALTLQFLGESVLMSLFALALALGLMQAALPAFEALAGRPVIWEAGWVEGVVVVGLAGAVGLLAGAYPAFVLAGFDAARVLKGSAPLGRGIPLRKVLVVCQFAVAVGLVASAAVVFQQVRFMQAQNLGFAMDEGGELLALDLPYDGSLNARLETVKARLAALPGVAGVAASALTPGDGSNWGGGGTLERESGEVDDATLRIYGVDADFTGVYGLEVVAGRGFSSALATDSLNYLLNEAAVRRYGFTSSEAAVGRQVNIWGREGEVVGVVRDFHHEGLQAQVEPTGLVLEPEWAQAVTLRIRPGDVQRTVEAAEALWAELSPAWPFRYTFVDERFNRQYQREVRFGRLLGVFAGLGICIACLGLLGLAAFAVQQRAKEIGVRKVLGASVRQVVVLLSKDFAALVLVGFAVAAPLAYLALGRWLEAFAYQAPLGAGAFAFAGGLVLSLALLTVGLQALRAATQDPAKALRDE